jgi:hypothetical protein
MLKVSASYFDGWKASGSLIISAPDAVAKARAFAELFWQRLGVAFAATHVELVGHSACWGPLAPATEPAEVLLRLSVRDPDKSKIEAFSKLVPAVILSGPPGVAVTGGRPQAQEVVAYWPALVPRDRVKPRLVTKDGERELEWPTPIRPAVAAPPLPRESWPSANGATKTVRVPLSRLAHARSGDKGDTCNIGVIARAPEIYPWLKQTLTAAVVKRRFKGVCEGKVTRFEVPNLWALNFLLERSLGGGGTVSLRLDAQGKTLSHALLAMEVEAPRALVNAAERADNEPMVPRRSGSKAPRGHARHAEHRPAIGKNDPARARRSLGTLNASTPRSCSGVSMSPRIMHRSISALALAAAWLLAVSATPVCGIYVSTTSGTDSPSCGMTSATACKTINQGIARAAALVVHCVNVRAGTYNETVHMAGGVSIDGGYDVSWVRGPYANPANQVKIVGGFDASEGQFITIVAHDLTAPARISNLIVTEPTRPAPSGGNGLGSYAIHVRNSRLFITDVRIEAGNGAPGAAGTTGRTPVPPRRSRAARGQRRAARRRVQQHLAWRRRIGRHERLRGHREFDRRRGRRGRRDGHALHHSKGFHRRARCRGQPGRVQPGRSRRWRRWRPR